MPVAEVAAADASDEDKIKALVLPLLLFFFALVTGPSRSLSLKLSDTRVYEP